jgi:hypothetical protein
LQQNAVFDCAVGVHVRDGGGGFCIESYVTGAMSIAGIWIEEHCTPRVESCVVHDLFRVPGVLDSGSASFEKLLVLGCALGLEVRGGNTTFTDVHLADCGVGVRVIDGSPTVQGSVIGPSHRAGVVIESHAVEDAAAAAAASGQAPAASPLSPPLGEFGASALKLSSASAAASSKAPGRGAGRSAAAAAAATQQQHPHAPEPVAQQMHGGLFSKTRIFRAKVGVSVEGGSPRFEGCDVYWNTDGVSLAGPCVASVVACNVYDNSNIGIWLRDGEGVVRGNYGFDNGFATMLCDGGAFIVEENKLCFEKDGGALVLRGGMAGTGLAPSSSVSAQNLDALKRMSLRGNVERNKFGNPQFERTQTDRRQGYQMYRPDVERANPVFRRALRAFEACTMHACAESFAEFGWWMHLAPPRVIGVPVASRADSLVASRRERQQQAQQQQQQSAKADGGGDASPASPASPARRRSTDGTAAASTPAGRAVDTPKGSAARNQSRDSARPLTGSGGPTSDDAKPEDIEADAEAGDGGPTPAAFTALESQLIAEPEEEPVVALPQPLLARGDAKVLAAIANAAASAIAASHSIATGGAAAGGGGGGAAGAGGAASMNAAASARAGASTRSAAAASAAAAAAAAAASSGGGGGAGMAASLGAHSPGRDHNVSESLARASERLDWFAYDLVHRVESLLRAATTVSAAQAAASASSPNAAASFSAATRGEAAASVARGAGGDDAETPLHRALGSFVTGGDSDDSAFGPPLVSPTTAARKSVVSWGTPQRVERARSTLRLSTGNALAGADASAVSGGGDDAQQAASSTVAAASRTPGSTTKAAGAASPGSSARKPAQPAATRASASFSRNRK